jgi:16S rRNA (uracil1498-N3)-methyltransferase
MTRRRFYAPPERFSADGTSVRLGTEETRHLRNVLRLGPGDEIYLFDGLAREFRGEVQTVTRDSTEVTAIKEVEAAQPESRLNLTLAIALLKGEKFDLVIQKATELGVALIIPVMTSRADVRIKGDDEAGRKTTRWQRIALEATKQCGRARLMRIESPVAFTNLVKVGGEASLMFAERDGIPFAETLSAGLLTADVTALVGPEGSWSDEEIAQARDSGWKIVTLGGRILRAETAAIVVATLIQYRFGDLS